MKIYEEDIRLSEMSYTYTLNNSHNVKSCKFCGFASYHKSKGDGNLEKNLDRTFELVQA